MTVHHAQKRSVRRCRSSGPRPMFRGMSACRRDSDLRTAPRVRSATLLPAGPCRDFVRKLRAILIADVVESVRLMEQDENDMIRRWREFIDAVLNVHLPQHRGRMVKSLGDGMLLEFESVSDCVQSAIALLAWWQRANAGLTVDRQIRLRIGIHLADVVIDDIDVFGDGVNLAARLASLGGPQEIIVSGAVRDQLSDGFAIDFEYLGERKLRNLQRLVRTFRVSATQPEGFPLARRTPRTEPCDSSVAAISCAQSGAFPIESTIASMRDRFMGALSNVISRLSTVMSC